MTLELTDAQRAHLDTIRDKWIASALNTDPIDRSKATAAIEAVYRQIGRPMPPIDWQSSLKASIFARGRWMTVFPNAGKPGRPATPEEYDRVQAVTDGQAKAKLAGWSDCRLGGNTWAGWHAYAEACRYLGVANIEQVDAYNAVAEQVGWWWPYAEVCIVTDRPELIRFDDRQRLHAEGGPAMRWRDGWSIWSWHGIDTTEKIIMGDFAAADFLLEPNAETRRVMAEVKGWGWVIAELGATKIAVDEYGTKWHVDLHGGLVGDEEDEEWGGEDEEVGEALLIEVLNSTPEPDGTIKTYFLSVDPVECRDLSPKDCIGWTFHLAPGEYAPEVMS